MNTKKIAFSVSGQSKTFEVIDIYPYRINPSQDKVVLHLLVFENDATYEDIFSLKSCDGIIDQYDRTITIDPETGEEIIGEWEKTNTYDNYNSKDITMSYQDGVWTVQLTRIGVYEQYVEENSNAILDLAEYIAELEDRVTALEGGN